MMTLIREWLRGRRYQVLARQLRSLPARELRALGIMPSDIDQLAWKVVLS